MEIMDIELLGLAEVAALANTKTTVVSNWRTRDSRFPTPVSELRSGPVFDRDSIVKYLRRRGRSMAHVISTINLKSGVGKTTTTVGRVRGVPRPHRGVHRRGGGHRVSAHDGSAVASAAQRLAEALIALGEQRPELAVTVADLATAVIGEATRTPRFANAIHSALSNSAAAPAATRAGRRSRRRAAGAIDPFAVYAEGGEAGLRDRLLTLDLEQLRDIVAQHCMDHDRLAMKWKDPTRVIDRIVEKVASRSAKGSAFREA